MFVPPISVPALAPPWQVTDRSISSNAVVLEVRHGEGIAASLRLQRCATGRLREAYPVSAYDIEIGGIEDLPGPLLTELAAQLAGGLERSEPRCRRIVLAIPQDAHACAEAARAAGFHPIVEVDLPGAQLILHVAEPEWVRAHDSDRVPGA